MHTKSKTVLGSLNEARELTDIQAAYLAGFVDGEGSIFALREKRKENRSGYGYAVAMTVPQSDFNILKSFRDSTGVGAISTVKKMKHHHKDQWKWILRQNQMKHVLKMIGPHLIIKKAQAEIALEFISIKENHLHSYSNNDAELQHQYYEKLRELNRRGERNIPVFEGIRPVVEKQERKCNVEGCNNKHYGHGLCRKHYRWSESGTMNKSDKTFEELRKCEFCGEKLPEGSYISTKFCSISCKMKHHRRDGCYSEEALNNARKCEVDGCDRPHHSGGMCRRHYMRKWHAENGRKIA